MLARWVQFCKDCYIISTCTPSCPATGTAWLWGLAQAGAWLCYPLRWLSIYNKEWDITVIQPISSTSTSELFRIALVDIWIDLYLIKFQFLAILCVFTRGQFWPLGVVDAWVCLCVCVRLCVNHKLVRAITHHPFQLGSPNLDQRCKRPWLRSLLFSGTIDRDL